MTELQKELLQMMKDRGLDTPDTEGIIYMLSDGECEEDIRRLYARDEIQFNRTGETHA